MQFHHTFPIKIIVQHRPQNTTTAAATITITITITTNHNNNNNNNKRGRDGTPVIMDLGSAAPARRDVASKSDAMRIEDEAATKCSAPYRAPELTEVREYRIEAGTKRHVSLAPARAGESADERGRAR